MKTTQATKRNYITRNLRKLGFRLFDRRGKSLYYRYPGTPKNDWHWMMVRVEGIAIILTEERRSNLKAGGRTWEENRWFLTPRFDAQSWIEEVRNHITLGGDR